MNTNRAWLVVAVVSLVVALDARFTVSAQTSEAVGPQSTYKLAAGRDKDDDGARGSRNSPAVVNPNDDDDKPRIRRRPADHRHETASTAATIIRSEIQIV